MHRESFGTVTHWQLCAAAVNENPALAIGHRSDSPNEVVSAIKASQTHSEEEDARDFEISLCRISSEILGNFLWVYSEDDTNRLAGLREI